MAVPDRKHGLCIFRVWAVCRDASQPFYYTNDDASDAAAGHGRDLSEKTMVSVYHVCGSKPLVWLLFHLYEYASDGSIFPDTIFLRRGKEKYPGIPAENAHHYWVISVGNWHSQYHFF